MKNILKSFLNILTLFFVMLKLTIIVKEDINFNFYEPVSSNHPIQINNIKWCDVGDIIYI